MDNYNQVLEAQAIQLHSAGLATERYKIYLDSIEGKANTLKASMETLWEKAINDNVIKFFLDLGIASVETIDKIGGLIPILEAVIGLVGVLSAQIVINLIGKLGAATAAIEGFSFSLISLKLLLKTTMSWVSILQIAIGALTAVVITYQQTVKKQQDLGLENTTNAWSDAFNNLGEEIKTTEQVMGEYKKMVDSVNEAHEKGGWIASLFVDKQKILDQGLKEVIVTLKETTSNYNDYIEAVEKAAGLAGYTVDENGRFIKSMGLSQQAIVKTSEDFGVLTDEQLALFNATEAPLDSWVTTWNESLYTQEEQIQNLIDSYEQLKSEADAISKAYEEQNENGYISIQTANELVMANADLYQYLTKTADGYIFSAEAARIDTFNKLQNAVASYNLESATIAAANGNYALAISAIQTSTMLQAEKESAIGLVNVLASLASLGNIAVPEVPSLGGGGAAPKVETEEEKRIKVLEKEKDALEDLKKEWKDRLDAFKDYIRAQKESLRLAKEEDDFNKKLSEKNKDLAELKAEIALLELDNSEEAKAKRLELEQEAADLELEIQEDKEDRKYELQMDALDKAEDEYETYVDSIIGGIEDQIDAINDLIETLREMVSEATGGTGGGFPKVQKSIQDIINELHKLGVNTEGLTELQLRNIDKMIDRWKKLGFEVERYARLARAAADAARSNYSLAEVNAIAAEIYQEQHGAGSNVPAIAMHSGGIVVEKHHDGNFAGSLASNEVFAKLLKGEYVATEGQMDNFLKNILPQIGTKMSNYVNNQSSNPNISVNMPITVQGNMDKGVVNDIEKIADKVINEINISLKQRGFVRQTSLTSYI